MEAMAPIEKSRDMQQYEEKRMNHATTVLTPDIRTFIKKKNINNKTPKILISIRIP
jgi:hypothetical protein